MSPLYEYKTDSPNTRQRSVCDMWNLAYNLEHGQMKYDIPELTGRGVLRSSCISRDIKMIDYNVNFYVPVELRGVSKNPHFDILFCIGKSIHWELPESRKNFDLLTGESCIGISKETKKRCIFPAEQDMNIVEIKIPLPTLHEILDEYCNGLTLDCLNTKGVTGKIYQLTPAIQVILHQLLHCPYNFGLRRLYTEAKLLELLAVYFSESVLQTDKPISSLSMSLDDVKSIRSAKEILDNNLLDPPTIRQLSRLVKLNEYKLKKGFKELFSMPVHAYVIQRKLELAKLLLDSNSISVSEAACRAGYGNVSHFASAFRKQYGTNPGNYMKAIKNETNF